MKILALIKTKKDLEEFYKKYYAEKKMVLNLRQCVFQKKGTTTRRTKDGV